MQPVPDTSPQASRQFAVLVNGQVRNVPTPNATGRSILALAGFNPPSDHLLILLTRPGSRSIGLDEVADLSIRGREEFRAFHTDRSFGLTVDEIGYEWGEGEISEATLRDIAGVPDNKILVLARREQPDEVVPEGGSVILKNRGVEHLTTKKRFVTVTYSDDNIPFKLEPREYTGAELAGIFGVPNGYVLDLIDDGFHPIKPDERIRVKDGMHFVSQPCKGASS